MSSFRHLRPGNLLATVALALALAAQPTIVLGQKLAPAGLFLADVDLEDVPVDRALRFLSELYDVSIVAGQLPDHRISVRLRGVPATDAFESVAIASGLQVEHRGSVVLVLPDAGDSATRQIVPRSLIPRSGQGSEWLSALDVGVRRLGDRALVLEGTEAAVQTAVAALELARDAAVTDRVFPLGAATGEETLRAVEPLLDDSLEAASYDATGHQLTVSALPETLDRVDALVAALTRAPTQFEIEVRVVEVSSNALKRIGSQGFFRLDVRGGLLPTTFPLDGLDDSSRYFPSPNDLSMLNDVGNVGGGPIDASSLSDSGFRFGQIDGRGIGFLIELLEQSGEAQVVATPKVTALDNRWARISMVTTLRIPTFTQNQAFATTTVSGIEEVDVGTTLEVRPRSGEGREILLAVTPEVSELEPTLDVVSQGGLTQGLPVVTRRRTETEVILETGETLVIGGLVREREDTTLGKTPGLGDLPVIGRAFRHKGRDFTSTELLVFVTPRELPSPEERRAKVRIDEQWIPAGLAARVQRARELTASQAPAERRAGVQSLETLDAELLEHGLDLGRDLVALGADPSLEVRVAAALFLLRQRPATALGELVRFAGSRNVALSSLGAPMAPHLRAALAELVTRSDGGLDRLARQFRTALDARHTTAAAHLLEALSAAAPQRAAELVAGLPSGDVDRVLTPFQRSAPGSHTLGLRRVRTPGESVTIRATREPALAWSGSPGEIDVWGPEAGVDRVHRALELLAQKAPDLRHLVGFALARIETGAETSSVDPAGRGARIRDDAEPARLAHRLVRLATLVFESRVQGVPATSRRSLARGVREEIRALELLTGAPCPPERAESMIRKVLESANPWRTEHDREIF